MSLDFFAVAGRMGFLYSGLVFFLAVCNIHAENHFLVGNGSFEEDAAGSGPAWTGKGNYWKGSGICEITSKESFAGRRSLRFLTTSPESRGQSSSGAFHLVPDRKYRVSYAMKRSGEQISGRLSLEFSSGKSSGAFVCHSTKESLKKSANAWQKISGGEMNILFFLPPGSKRKYLVLKDGVFSVPSKIYGREPVKCIGKLYVSGIGEVFFDQIEIEEIKSAPSVSSKSRLGFGDAGKEEADILLMGTQSKSNRRRPAEQPVREKYRLALPPAVVAAPVRKVKSGGYPPVIADTKFNGARVERGGRPVFLLGVELLSPYLCRMHGFDFWVNSAFGNRVNAKLDGDVVRTSLAELPFLEEQVREHLENGVLVWIDLLQDYKAWHSSLLRDYFPGLFVTREGFFCWRPEEPRAQALRHATWYNAVKRTGKYPVFVYELFNEVCYEDHSPYNYQNFRRKMKEKYATVEKANAAWGTSYASFQDVVPYGNDPLMDSVNRISPQLKAEWSLFTEERFAEIARDSVDWMRKLVPESRLSLQSYNGLPFDYQNNFVNPYLVNPEMDLTIAEFNQDIYPQWKNAENEEEILSSMRRDLDVSLSRLSSPDKPVIDGECRFGAMTKMASDKNVIADLNGRWLFRPAAVAPPEKLNESDSRELENGQDTGRKEGWQKPELNLSDWQTIQVPGMWGQQGHQACYIGWYRKDFFIPENSGRLYLSGQKLSDRGDIFLNGKLLHQTLKWDESFSIDITDHVHRGQKNVLCIRIYNNYFHNGYFYGGIRDRMHITNVSLQAMPLTPDQIAFGMGLRALQGYSGLCLSYFYINWMEDWSCSILNPEKYQPEAVAALPRIKNRINDLAPLIFRKKHQYRDVAVTYSLNSARAYIPSNQTMPREMSFDIARYYSGAVFSHRGTDAVSDDVLDNYDKMKQFKVLILCRAAAVSQKALENIRRFAEEGGTVIVDRMSLRRNAYDGSAVDASGLLGVVRGKASREPLKNIGVRGLEAVFSTRQSSMSDGAHYAPLDVRDAQVFACAGRIPVGAVRQVGRGRIYTFTAELAGSDYAEVFRKIFQDGGIGAELDIRGGKYVEVHTRRKDGSFLWALFNRGMDARLTVSGSVPAGNYLVRECHEGRELVSPSGRKFWTAEELSRGIRIGARNLVPVYLLIEPDNAEKIVLSSVPAGQQQALDKFFLPLWKDMKQPKKRVLWYGYTHYAPTSLPSAAKVMRDMGIAVDFMADRSFTPELKVIRGGKKVVAPLNSYDLVVIPRSRASISEQDSRGLKDYMAAGGSLLLLAGHVYNFHTYYNYRMKGIVKMMKIRVVDAAIEDAEHQRAAEIRRFNTRQIGEHPVTEGVKTFAAMGATGVALPGGENLIRAENSARTPAGVPVILTVKESGKNRIALCGDSDWLSPEGMVLEDNARLWTNLVAWLCRMDPLAEKQLRESVALPEF